MYRADAFTPFNLNLSARTGSARACARDRQNRHKRYALSQLRLWRGQPREEALHLSAFLDEFYLS